MVVWLCYTALCSGFIVHDTNSKGSVHFSLRSNSLLLSSSIASTFSWWRRRLSLCFLAKRLISAITNSILRSLWRSAFRAYQGASTIFLSTVFWNLCIMAVLLCFAHPIAVCHRSTRASVSVCRATACYVLTWPIVTLKDVRVKRRWPIDHRWQTYWKRTVPFRLSFTVYSFKYTRGLWNHHAVYI